MNMGRGSVVDSNFLCSEYDGKVNQAANEIDSWEWDHSCNTRNVTADGKYLGEVDTLGISSGVCVLSSTEGDLQLTNAMCFIDHKCKGDN